MDHFSFDPVASVFTALGALIGVTVWLSRVQSVARQAAEDIKEMKPQIAAALAVAASVTRLADAVENGAKLSGLKLETLADKITEHADFTKDRFQEIKDQMVRDHAFATRTAGAAARGRTRAEAAREED
jgi:Zn-dependent M16 (insulinase) family peptidase